MLFRSGEIAAPSADGSGSASQPGFHLDLLWWGPTPPDFGAARITPATPPCVFALA